MNNYSSLYEHVLSEKTDEDERRRAQNQLWETAMNKENRRVYCASSSPEESSDYDEDDHLDEESAEEEEEAGAVSKMKTRLEKEIEEEREKVRLFDHEFLANSSTSEYELQHLRHQSIGKNYFPARETATATPERHRWLSAAEEKPIAMSEDCRITDEDRAREFITVRKGDAEISVMIENYVYVTKFVNSQTKEPYLFNLHDLAIKTLAYGTEYSKHKFSKVTLKYKDGPSLLFFASGSVVETGTYSPIIARKSLDHSVRILREVCLYSQIEVRSRTCENIVAKGTLNFGICLDLLAKKYPTCVRYDNEEFTGAIIQLSKLCDYDDASGSAEEDDDSGGGGGGGGGSSDHSSASGHCFDSPRRTTGHRLDIICYETTNDDIKYNSGFDYYDIDTDKTIKSGCASDRSVRTAVSLRDFATAASGWQRQPVIFGDGLHDVPGQAAADDDETTITGEEDEMAIDKILNGLTPYAVVDNLAGPVKKENITVLVFRKGRIICAGCKSRRQVIRSYARIIGMLEEVRDSPENIAMEKEALLNDKRHSAPRFSTYATQPKRKKKFIR